MKPFVAAAVQIAPQPGPLTAESIKANLANAVDWVTRCVESTGADLVVLPETCTTGFTPGVGAADLWDLVSDVPGHVTEPIQQVAAELGVHVVHASYVRGPERGLVHNAAIFIGPGGDVLGVYRKTHLFAGETVGASGWVTPGDDVVVVDTPFARLGATICFDGDFPELARIQAVLGAEVIVKPSAFLRSADIWELTTRARAYDNHVHVVAANAVGQDPAGVLYFGNSLIVTPVAHVIARGTTHEGWAAARLDPDSFQRMSPGSSQPQLFDHLAARNVELYAKYASELTKPAATPYPHPQLGMGDRQTG